MVEPNIPQGAGQRANLNAVPKNARPSFGVDANTVRIVEYDLSQPRTFKEVRLTGTFLWAFSASSLNAELDVFLNEQSVSPLTFTQGFQISGIRFDQLFLSNSAQPGESIKFMALVESENNVNIENPQIAFQNVSLSKPTTYDGSGDQSINNATTDTIAANSARREITVQADRSNTGELKLRDSGGNLFAVIGAGESATIPGTAELQVRNDSGGAQTYRYLEVAD